jgi:hypothetical protein
MIARESVADSNSIRQAFSLGTDTLEGKLRRLENLGFIRGNKERQFVLANYFFRRWLQEMHDHTQPAVTAEVPAPVKTEEEPGLDSDEQQAAGGLFAEMQRRSVFRVGIAYVVVAWVLLQLGEISFDFLEVPSWAGKLLRADAGRRKAG